MLNFKDIYYNATRRRGLWLAAVIFALVTPWAMAQTKAGSSSDGEDMKYKGLAEVDLFGRKFLPAGLSGTGDQTCERRE